MVYGCWFVSVYGKIDRCLFRDVVLGMLGSCSDNLVLEPRLGVDFCVIRVGDRDLVVSVDPFFILPEYGWFRAVWYALHVLVADVVVAGVKPKYLFLELNLPLDMSDRDFTIMWRFIHRVALDLGLSIAGGHIERYSGVEYPMLGGGMVLGVAGRDEWVSPTLVEPGDEVVLVKGGGIETAATLSMLFPRVWVESYGIGFSSRVDRVFFMQSVYSEALSIAGLGLRSVVKCMHDATEYGVYGALYDLFEASGYGVHVYYNKLFIDNSVARILDLYMDFSRTLVNPYWVTSEGTLVVVTKKGFGERIVEYLYSLGVKASVVGYITREECVVLEKNGSIEEITIPSENHFYKLFHNVLREYKRRWRKSTWYTRFK